MLKLKYKIGLIPLIIIILTPVVYGAITRFRDVPENIWYSDALYSLEEKGIISGYPDNTFRPGNTVNRAELVAVLDNLLEYIESEDGEVALNNSKDPLSQGQVANLPRSLILDVPFTSQAPTGDWSLPYQEACEEASLIMVEYYIENAHLDAEIADKEILDLVAYERKNKYKVDIGVSESAEIVEDYFKRESFEYYGGDVTIENIKKLLALDYPVIVPVAGQILANPNYSNPGPKYHMIIIIGYNEDGFIAHDTGTSHGENYQYSYDVIADAIHDWTGKKRTIEEGERAILVFR